MDLISFTNLLGGPGSQLGLLIIGYDILDEVVVIWIGNRSEDDGSEIQTFGMDNDGFPIILKRNKPTILSYSQAIIAQNNDAILLCSRPLQ